MRLVRNLIANTVALAALGVVLGGLIASLIWLYLYRRLKSQTEEDKNTWMGIAERFKEVSDRQTAIIDDYQEIVSTQTDQMEELASHLRDTPPTPKTTE